MSETSTHHLLNISLTGKWGEDGRINAQFVVDFTRAVGEEGNLRASEAKEWAQRVAENIKERLKLPEGIQWSEVKPQQQNVTTERGTGLRCVVIGKILDHRPAKKSGQSPLEDWVAPLQPAFKTIKESVLAELDDPPVHNREGEVIDGAHVTRATSPSRTPSARMSH